MMLEVLAMTYSVDANNNTPDPFTLTDVNVWELQEKWLLDLMKEYDMTRGSDIDVRIYRLLEDIKMQMILLCPHFIFNEPADINPYFTRQRKWELIMSLCKTGLTWSCLKLPKIPILKLQIN